tara:strand:+ start:1485 stop:1613 length:129 start_codon:yes stop_codon:yes gene_type:complete
MLGSSRPRLLLVVTLSALIGAVICVLVLIAWSQNVAADPVLR